MIKVAFLRVEHVGRLTESPLQGLSATVDALQSGRNARVTTLTPNPSPIKGEGLLRPTVDFWAQLDRFARSDAPLLPSWEKGPGDEGEMRYSQLSWGKALQYAGCWNGRRIVR